MRRKKSSRRLSQGLSLSLVSLITSNKVKVWAHIWFNRVGSKSTCRLVLHLFKEHREEQKALSQSLINQLCPIAMNEGWKNLNLNRDLNKYQGNCKLLIYSHNIPNTKKCPPQKEFSHWVTGSNNPQVTTKFQTVIVQTPASA